MHFIIRHVLPIIMKLDLKISIKQFLVIVFVFSLFELQVFANGAKKPTRKKSFVALMFLKTKSGFNITDNRKGCRWLKGLKHQYKLCMNKKGLSQVLRATRSLSLTSCKKHFRYEQWPCLVKKKYFNKVYRETALLFSLSSSVLMYEIAKACSSGNLENCACGSHERSDMPSEWEWGGCSDNTRYARTFTNKFYQLKKKGGDKMRTILKYNSEVGINIVLKNEEKICHCHGISGSCSFRICYKRINPFDKIAEDLRTEYHNAIQIQTNNDIAQFTQTLRKEKLLFLEDVLNFCPETHGRHCENDHNCATLCCGRGASPKIETFTSRCNCEWQKGTLNVSCEQCQAGQTVYVCN